MAAKKSPGEGGKRVKSAYPQVKDNPDTTGRRSYSIEHNVVAGSAMNAGANNPNAEARSRAKAAPGNNGQ
jgi:hypothetical protein